MSACACVCVCVCVWGCVCIICVHVHVHVRVCVCVCARMRSYYCMHVCMNACVCACLHVWCMHVCACASVCSRHVCVHVFMYSCVLPSIITISGSSIYFLLLVRSTQIALARTERERRKGTDKTDRETEGRKGMHVQAKRHRH